jgi:hypothetical protein
MIQRHSRQCNTSAGTKQMVSSCMIKSEKIEAKGQSAKLKEKYGK